LLSPEERRRGVATPRVRRRCAAFVSMSRFDFFLMMLGKNAKKAQSSAAV